MIKLVRDYLLVKCLDAPRAEAPEPLPDGETPRRYKRRARGNCIIEMPLSRGRVEVLGQRFYAPRHNPLREDVPINGVSASELYRFIQEALNDVGLYDLPQVRCGDTVLYHGSDGIPFLPQEEKGLFLICGHDVLGVFDMSELSPILPGLEGLVNDE